MMITSRSLAACAISSCLVPLAHAQQGQGPESLLRVFAEDFRMDAQRDREKTSADWAQAFPGALRPGKGGGYGVHGDLRVEQGVVVLDVDRQFFSPAQTRFGVWLGPIDDAFHFSSIYVAPGAVLKLNGSHGARVFAASLDVRGTLDVSGEEPPLHFSANDPCPLGGVSPWVANDTGRGGNGGRGGPGGGDGGSGGDDPRPVGPAPGGMPANPGSILRLAPEHLDGENGRGAGRGWGSQRFPFTSIDANFAVRLANVVINPTVQYALQAAGGGGGGSFGSAGSAGLEQPGFTGPGGAGGPLPPFDPTLPPTVAFGGSGGGGGGVHSYFTNIFRFGPCHSSYPPGSRPTMQGQEVVERWNTGAAGGGGGGYLYVQCADLSLAGALISRGGAGGSCALFGSTLRGTDTGAGGGGGSGGAIRLDLSRSVQLGSAASIDVSGGIGGLSALAIGGGDGGRGVVHVREAQAPGAFASIVSPASALTTAGLQASDEHPFSFATSRYYRSQAGRPVQRVIDAIVTFAIARTNSSSPVDPTDPRQVFTAGVPASLLAHLGPAYVSYQCAQDDGRGNPVASTESLWTADPTQLDPAKTLVRFTLLIDRSWFTPLGPIAGIVGFELFAL